MDAGLEAILAGYKGPVAPGFNWVRSLIILLVLGGAAFASWNFARILKKKGSWKGSRRYLIETLAQVPVGDNRKTNVTLLKIGSEFILVGVTAEHVSFLSSLPRLQEQYLEESSMERDTFNEAVKEETFNIKKSQGVFS
jgi:flagellar biogenesis protein FliO